MPRVKQVTARKDYPNHGIKKGDLHYRWVLKTGPRTSREFRQKFPPTRGQLTTSEFLQTVYSIVDNDLRGITEPDEVQDLLDALETAKDECQEKFDNMPEGLQQGNTGVTLEERVSQCDDFINSIESAKADWEQGLGELKVDSTDKERDALREAFFTEVEGAEPSWS